MGTAGLQDIAVPTAIPGLFVVPANQDLVGLESDLSGDASRAFKLRNAVAGLAAQAQAKPAEEAFKYVLIDCPPSLSILTLNALAAADAVLVPVQCEFFALEGISQLKESIDQIRATLNPSLEIQGVVLTMHDARTTLSREVADEVRAFFGPKVYESVIPRNTRVAEAPSHGKPILLYDYDCAGSQAYIRLATEIIERERQTKAA
jgi:chromosome partitioning protein